jgi:hypothetical protein
MVRQDVLTLSEPIQVLTARVFRSIGRRHVEVRRPVVHLRVTGVRGEYSVRAKDRRYSDSGWQNNFNVGSGQYSAESIVSESGASGRWIFGMLPTGIGFTVPGIGNNDRRRDNVCGRGSGGYLGRVGTSYCAYRADKEQHSERYN